MHSYSDQSSACNLKRLFIKSSHTRWRGVGLTGRDLGWPGEVWVSSSAFLVSQHGGKNLCFCEIEHYLAAIDINLPLSHTL